MSWNKERYLEMKNKCANDIAKGHKKASDYMLEYIRI